MGEFGRRLAGAGARGTIETLKRAFADEWCGHYNFRFAALAARGYRSPGLVALLRRRSDAALARAERLGERLRELGALPPDKVGALVDKASDKPFKLPGSSDDVAGILRAVLDAERTSLRTYDALLRRSGSDPLTWALALDLLREAAASEDELERLSGDPAPDLDGK